MNDALDRASGDYFILMSGISAIEDKEWLTKMPIPGTMTSYAVTTGHFTQLPTPNFGLICAPREVYERVGHFDERFKDGYGFCDDDYAVRAYDLGIPFQAVSVRFNHRASITTETYFGMDRHAMFERNAALFFKKYGDRFHA